MSDPLLVPMHLEAMVVNKEAEVAEDFKLATPDYTKLKTFQPVGPAPFFPGDQDAIDAGIYLHWTLPRPLRHAPDATAGGEGWPLVPNRWVVVRIDESGASKAWIVCSDATTNGSSPFVIAGEATNIGATVPMTPELTSAGLPAASSVLKAVGPGTAHFAVFAPGVKDVFALYDDVTDGAGQKIQNGTFTYHVAGWYESPAPDPLASVEWNQPAKPGGPFVDKTFGFRVWLGNASPPTQMLVHAMRHGVSWDRDANNPRATRYPQHVSKDVRVAVGNTAADALAALVRLSGKPEAGTWADLLEAFQYGLLDALQQPAGSIVLDREIRKHWYSARPGGTLWTVVQPEPAQPTALATPPAAPLTQQQAEALATLNSAQRTLDRQQRLFEGMAWNLYALWFKQQYVSLNQGAPGLDSSLVDWFTAQLGAQVDTTSGSYLDQVNAQGQAVRTANTAVADARKALDGTGGLLHPQTQVLKPAGMPDYHGANDPVVLITGLGRSTQLDPVVDLACRLPAQAVTKLTIGKPYGQSDVDNVAPLPDGNNLLPDGVQGLHAEAVFLSPPLCAKLLLGDESKRGEVSKAFNALLTPGDSNLFAPPLESRELWEQPWVPVLLDWRITVLDAPAYAEASPSHVHELQQSLWSLHGADFRWTGPTDPDSGYDVAASASMQLSGRTFVTPHLNFAIADRLDTYVDYVKAHPSDDPELDGLLENLDAYLDALRKNDVLSQRLSGLRARIAQRDLTPAPQPPDGEVASALAASGTRLPYRGFPAPYAADVSPPVWDFAPAAGTFFVIDRLTVVDFMGRAVDLTIGNENTIQPSMGGRATENGFYPIAGRGLKAKTTRDPVPKYPGVAAHPTERMLQLLPRLSQEALLSFRAISNDKGNVDVDLSAGANPVCGWIVPNHLDRSLALYAPDGTPWGELFLSGHSSSADIPHWQADPTNPAAPPSPAAIPNTYVSAMLTPLVQPDAGAALSDLLAAIDDALWSIDAGAPRSGQDLSVLVGRPIAIVRAELALKLHGTVWTSQDWWNTFDADPSKWTKTVPAALAEVDGGVRDMRWPVRLGEAALRDDGLIGYFLDGPSGPDWSSFAVVRLPTGATSDYLKRIGKSEDSSKDAGYIELKLTDDRVEPAHLDPAANEVQRLTMLVDPRASVHAFTGLLPVTTFRVDPRFVTPVLRALTYLFRAGPFLTPPDAVRIPRPAERRGTWSWFDEVVGSTAITPADGEPRLPTTPPIALEGWLKLTPNPPVGKAK